MKAGPSTRATISPAPLTLSAPTLLSRGGRSESRGGRNRSRTHRRKQSTSMGISAAAARRIHTPPTEASSTRVCRSTSLPETQPGSGTQISQEVGARLSSSQMQKWWRSFLSINHRRPSLLPPAGRGRNSAAHEHVVKIRLSEDWGCFKRLYLHVLSHCTVTWTRESQNKYK